MEAHAMDDERPSSLADLKAIIPDIDPHAAKMASPIDTIVWSWGAAVARASGLWI